MRVDSKMLSKKSRYVNVSIPEGLAKSIDTYIEQNSDLDLRSRAQVVNFALRKLFSEK